MSCTSRSAMRLERSLTRRGWLLLVLSLVLCGPALARELPAALRDEAPPLALIGSADMRHFGFKIYTARLWTTERAFHAEKPFALDLEYALDIDASALVDTSIAEIRQQGWRDEAQLARWARDMRAVFPDVRKGDRLIGLALPGEEARFYSARGYLASIRDPAFVDAFFGIWLRADTSAPRLRARLLGDGTRTP